MSEVDPTNSPMNELPTPPFNKEELSEFTKKHFNKHNVSLKCPWGDECVEEKSILSRIKLKLFGKFLRALDVSTMEEYLALPKKDRSHWGWYLTPYAMSCSGLSTSDSLLDGWDAFHKHVAKEFPVQFFFRDTIGGWFISRFQYRLPRWWYEQVTTRFAPKQKWLAKILPRTWCDKTTLIPMLNFECVKHFVEKEECFERINYDSDPDHQKFAVELKACYKFITKDLPQLERLRDGSYPKTHTGDYEKDYEMLNLYEKEINEQTTKWLTWIVVNRDFFWT